MSNNEKGFPNPGEVNKIEVKQSVASIRITDKVKKPIQYIPIYEAEILDSKNTVYGYVVRYPDGSVSLYHPDKWESFQVKPETLRLVK